AVAHARAAAIGVREASVVRWHAAYDPRVCAGVTLVRRARGRRRAVNRGRFGAARAAAPAAPSITTVRGLRCVARASSDDEEGPSVERKPHDGIVPRGASAVTRR